MSVINVLKWALSPYQDKTPGVLSKLGGNALTNLFLIFLK